MADQRGASVRQSAAPRGCGELAAPQTAHGEIRTEHDQGLYVTFAGVASSIDHEFSTGKILLGGVMYLGLIVPAYGYGGSCLPVRMTHR